MNSSNILSIPNSNPNLQPKIKEAREMFRYAAIFFLIAALIYGLWGLWDIFRGLISSLFWWTGSYYTGYRIFLGIFRIALAVVAIIVKGKFVDNIITPIDQGRYQESKDNMILYVILGLIFGLGLSGILILLGYMKLDELNLQAKNCPTCRSPLRYIPEQNDWYCDNCADYKVPVNNSQARQANTLSTGQQPTQQPNQQQPTQQQPPGQQNQQRPVSSPSQQHQGNQCPTCGGQMRYIEDRNEWYCDRCQEYN